MLKWFCSDLSNNQLTSIPNEIGKLTSLEELYDLLLMNNIFILFIIDHF
jgi:Leucine-rich repeat (LRR) protein